METRQLDARNEDALARLERLAQTNNTVSASFIVGPYLYPCRIDRNNDGTYNGRFNGVTVSESATLITVLKAFYTRLLTK